MSDRDYPMVVRRICEEDGGGYAAYAPDLYGCVGDGETAEAAVRDLLSAIAEWIDEATRLGRELPQPGSVSSRMAAERAELNSLLDAQQRLIDSQDEMLREQQDEIERIRTEIVALRTDDDRLAIPYSDWFAPAIVLAPSSSRRRTRISN